MVETAYDRMIKYNSPVIIKILKAQNPVFRNGTLDYLNTTWTEQYVYALVGARRSDTGAAARTSAGMANILQFNVFVEDWVEISENDGWDQVMMRISGYWYKVVRTDPDIMSGAFKNKVFLERLMLSPAIFADAPFTTN